ncbi:MAG TPA: protein kinase [Polyangiaceae bacterium]
MLACPACGNSNPPGARFCGACGRPTDEATANAALVGTTIAERYRVVRVIAEGGMGIVYEAVQNMGEGTRTVAIKTLLPELSRDPVVVSRFHRECAVVAGLEHPNTVRVYDFGTTSDGTLYIAMEYVRGRALGEVIVEGPMPLPRCIGILEQVCSALEEAHQQGIVHRDLKPDNLILCDRAGIHDWVKLLDFGIAKRVSVGGRHDTKLTQQGMVLGTPPYMSPEQFTSEPLDRTSDIYSLAIIFYEMINSKLPFEGDTPWQWAHQHMSVAPAPFSVPVPTSVENVVYSALAKRRSERPATALEFYRRLADASASARSIVSNVMAATSAFAAAERDESAPRIVRTEPSVFGDAEPPKTLDDTDGSFVATHTEPSVIAVLPNGVTADSSARIAASIPPAPLRDSANPRGTAISSALPFERSRIIAPPPVQSRKTQGKARRGAVALWLGAVLLLAAGLSLALWLGKAQPDDTRPPTPATAAPEPSIATVIAAESSPAPPMPIAANQAAQRPGPTTSPRRPQPNAVPTVAPPAPNAPAPTGVSVPASTPAIPPNTNPTVAAPPLTFPFPITLPTIFAPVGLPPAPAAAPGPVTTPQPAPGNPVSGLQHCSQATSLANTDLDAAVGQYQACEADVGKAAAAPTRAQLITVGLARARALAAQGRCDEANRIVQTLARIGAQRIVRDAINQAGCRG